MSYPKTNSHQQECDAQGRLSVPTGLQIAREYRDQLARDAGGFSLTAEQQHAVDRAVAAAMTPTLKGPRELLIDGPAGTGKTTVTKAVAEALQSRGLQVSGMAYTHSAAQRLHEVSGLDCSTTASVLALRPMPVNGRYVFKRNPRVEQKLDLADCWIVDEASMLPSAQHNVLRKDADPDQLFIFVGDSAQLSPIADRAK